MARATYTTREPWTEGFHRLANTVNQILEARNQKSAMEQQSKAMQQKQELEKIKTGYEMTNKAMEILKDPYMHKSLKKTYAENFNKSVAGPYGITPLPTDIDYDDESFNTMVKQLDSVKKQLEKGTIGLSEVPQMFNTIIDDNMSRYGIDSKEVKALEGIIKRHKETIGNEQFSTFKDIASRPETMGRTPEEQNATVKQMAANLSNIDPDLGSKLEKEFSGGDKDGTPVKLLNDVAKAYKGKGYDKLTQTEQQEVLQQYAQIQGTVAGAKTTGSAEANLDQPLGREAMYYFSPNDLSRAPSGMTKRVAQKKGYVIATGEEVQKINDIDITKGILIQLQEGSKRVITAKDKVEAAGQLAYSKLPTFMQDAQNKRYLETQDAYLGNVARTLGGERGVLTDQDLARQKRGLPAPGDTVAVRDAKIKLQNEFLTIAQEAAKAKLLGVQFNEEAYRKRINRVLDDMDKVSSTPSTPEGTSVGRFTVVEEK